MSEHFDVAVLGIGPGGEVAAPNIFSPSTEGCGAPLES